MNDIGILPGLLRLRMPEMFIMATNIVAYYDYSSGSLKNSKELRGWLLKSETEDRTTLEEVIYNYLKNEFEPWKELHDLLIDFYEVFYTHVQT